MYGKELECSTRNISQVLLPAGQASRNYQLTLCIGLTDRLGTESFSYAYSVVVTPATLTGAQVTAMLNSQSSYFQWFVAGGDAAQVSSFVIALTSSLSTVSDFVSLLDNAAGQNGEVLNYSTTRNPTASLTTMSAATQSTALRTTFTINIFKYISLLLESNLFQKSFTSLKYF